MKEPLDDELTRWRAQWQATGDPLPAAEREALRRRVRWRSRGLKLLAAGEALFAAGCLAALGRVAATSPHAVDAVVMAGLALLVVAALAFALRNRRGIWQAQSETTAALLTLSLARCRRRRRGLSFGWGLLTAEVVLFIPWIWLHLAARAGGSPEPAALLRAYGFLAVWAGGAAVTLLVIGRWNRREEGRLEALRRAIAG